MNYKKQFLLLVSQKITSSSISPIEISIPKDSSLGFVGTKDYISSDILDIPTVRLAFINDFFKNKIPHDNCLLKSFVFLPYKFLFQNFKNKNIIIHYLNLTNSGSGGLLCYFTFKDKLKDLLFEIHITEYSQATDEKISCLLDLKTDLNNDFKDKKTPVRTTINCFSKSIVETFSQIDILDSSLNLKSEEFNYVEVKKNVISILSYQSFGGFKQTQYEIEKIESDCLDYYEDAISDSAHEIIDLINVRKKGIILFHGEKGCGKTTFIKYLINNSDKNFFYINGESASGFSSGNFLEFIAGHSKNSIFIFEDMEHLIASREVKTNGLISDILNASDGILSDILSPIFIFTFNTKMKNVDSAFLRPGRLLWEQEFNKLTIENSKRVAKKLKVKLSENKEYTLAEIFGMKNSTSKSRSKSLSIEKNNIIKGFSHAK